MSDAMLHLGRVSIEQGVVLPRSLSASVGMVITAQMHIHTWHSIPVAVSMSTSVLYVLSAQIAHTAAQNGHTTSQSSLIPGVLA